MLFKNKTKWYLFFLILFSIVCYWPFLGNVPLFDWDEINFAEIAREMIITHKFSQPQINYQIFTEKPPLFFWMQALSMHIFGINEFAARFPNALLGSIVLPVIFLIGKKIKDNLFGFIWAMLYGCSILPHLYFKSGIIDPWFNFFIFISIYAIYQIIEFKQKNKNYYSWILVVSIAAGLSILTKGPVAILVLGLTSLIILIKQKFRNFLSIKDITLIICLTIIVAGLWLMVDFINNGNQFIKEFTIRQWELFSSKDAGHGGFFFYHFIVLFFGCFPITPFFIYAFKNKELTKDEFSTFKKWMLVLFWVVLILFSIVQTKIVHYSSLCYYPMSFIGAISVYYIISKKWILSKSTKFILVFSSLPFLLIPILISYAINHLDFIKSILNKDPFAVENLNADIHWTGLEILPALFLILMLWISVQLFKKDKRVQAFLILSLSSVLFLQSALFFYLHNIERISQDANIEFWEKHAQEDCYKISYNYRTYTTFFYGNILPQRNQNYANQDWLLKGDIDKPVYISCKKNNRIKLEEEITDAIFLYSKNGFYFYKRIVQHQ
jgi:4-amino-4-deoxy-L-arabinose transferase-like glycosyltransferase